jgi:hypothetical protein
LRRLLADGDLYRLDQRQWRTQKLPVGSTVVATELFARSAAI